LDDRGKSVSAEPEPDYAGIVARLSAVADRYCQIVELRSSLDRTSFARRIYLSLSELLAEGARLPLVLLSDGDDDDDDFDVPTFEEIKAEVDASAPARFEVYKSVQEKLGDWDPYSLVFDPVADTEAIRASLAVDIADIYQDLKKELACGVADLPAKEQVFEWKMGFCTHWGLHVVDALKALHFIVDRLGWQSHLFDS
jgi:hypothetical protein